MGCAQVELGAGVGLVSIVAGLLGACGVATDREPSVLSVLESNAAQMQLNHPLQTATLRWGESSKPLERAVQRCAAAVGSSQSKGVDLILAADIVFGNDPQIWRQLVDTLDDLSSAGTAVIMAHTPRYPEREKVFWQILGERFLVEQISHVNRESPNTEVYAMRRLKRDEDL